MTHKMRRASSTVARALQMTAARAVSRGLEAVDAIFTRLTLLVPERHRNVVTMLLAPPKLPCFH
jgi:hypothetical protein